MVIMSIMTAQRTTSGQRFLFCSDWETGCVRKSVMKSLSVK